jgi:hypothetical protein
MNVRPRLRTAASRVGAAGGIGLVTVLQAGPASALHPIEPGAGRSVVVADDQPVVVASQAFRDVSAPAPTPVREAATGGPPSHVGAGALGGVAVLLAAGAVLSRKGAKRTDPSSTSR